MSQTSSSALEDAAQTKLVDWRLSFVGSGSTRARARNRARNRLFGQPVISSRAATTGVLTWPSRTVPSLTVGLLHGRLSFLSLHGLLCSSPTVREGTVRTCLTRHYYSPRTRDLE